MKYLLAIFLVHSVFLKIQAINPDSIQLKFVELSIEQAIEKAKLQRKPGFIYFYAPWSSACKSVSDKTLNNKFIASYLNENFICVKQIFDSKNTNLNQLFNIQTVPTVLFLNSKGEILQKRSGYFTSEKLINAAQTALDSTKNLLKITERFNHGELSAEICLELLKNEFHNKNKLISTYFLKSDSYKRFDINSFEIISNFCSVNDSFFNFLLKNEKEFYATIGEQKVKEQIEERLTSFYQYDFQSLGLTKFEAKAFLDSLHFPIVAKIYEEDKKAEILRKIKISPTDKKNWLELFGTIEKLVADFGLSEKYECKTIALKLNLLPELKHKKMLETIRATNHIYALTLLENFDYLKIENCFNSKEFNPAKIEEINTSILNFIEHQYLTASDCNHLATKIFQHSECFHFLNNIKLLSIQACLNSRNSKYYSTSAAICAQLNLYAEAIIYEQKAIEIAQRTNDSELYKYQNDLIKLKNKQPINPIW